MSKLTQKPLDDQFIILMKTINKLLGVKFKEGYEMYPDHSLISNTSNVQWLQNDSFEMDITSIIDQLKDGS